MIRHLVLLCPALCAPIPGAPAAETVSTLLSPNAEPDGYFGWSVAGIEDANGDGYDDIVIGAYKEEPVSGPPGCGRVYIFSGAEASAMLTLASPNQQPGGSFGCSVSAAGDVNGDGHPDILVGAQNEAPGTSPTRAGRAYVIDGESGNTIHELISPQENAQGRFGWAVSGVGDVDGDGLDDAIVGAYNEDEAPLVGAGRAYVFSGAGGVPLVELDSPSPDSLGRFGWAVSTVGDVDGDDVPDVVVGAPLEESTSGYDEAGRAYVFSGATGGLVYELISPNQQTGGRFGYSVSSAGDISGDGTPDVLVGAPYEDGGIGLLDAGRVYLFDGATCQLLQTLVSPNQQTAGLFGRSIASAGDVNNDGCGDVAVGAYWEDGDTGTTNAGRVYVFDSTDGSLLRSLGSPNEEEEGRFGHAIAAAGDFDADMCPDLAVGAYREDGDSTVDAGRVYVVSACMRLTGHVSQGTLGLQWTACTGVSAYWIYGTANYAYFTPGLVPPYLHRLHVSPPGTTGWLAPLGIGDPDSSWTYLVVAVGTEGVELRRSQRFGERDHGVRISE